MRWRRSLEEMTVFGQWRGQKNCPLPVCRESRIFIYSLCGTRFERDIDSPNYYNLIKLIREIDEEAKRTGDPSDSSSCLYRKCASFSRI